MFGIKEVWSNAKGNVARQELKKLFLSAVVLRELDQICTTVYFVQKQPLRGVKKQGCTNKFRINLQKTFLLDAVMVYTITASNIK